MNLEPFRSVFAKRNPRLEKMRQPEWLYVGQEVWVPHVHEGKSCHAKCVIITARGDAGVVLNEKFGISKWVVIDDMLCEEKS